MPATPIVHPQIEAYLGSLHPAAEPVRREMEKLAAERDFPIIGPLVGQLCATVALAVGARRVFELGSGFGYSALWFCSVLPDGGEITLTEGARDNCERARDFLGRAGCLSRVKVRILEGDGLQHLAQERGPFDVIFCDVDKHQYPAALDLTVDRVRPGGALVTDNTLWGGRVADERARKPDANTAGVLEYDRRIFADPRLSSTIVPLRDGVAVSIRRPAPGRGGA